VGAGGAFGPGGAVVEFAGFGSAVAVGEAAGLVSDDHMLGESSGWPVSGGGQVDEAAEGVGDESAPGRAVSEGDGAGVFGGDGSDSGQLCGGVVEVEQGREGDGDLDAGSGCVPGRGAGQGQEGIGTVLISSPPVGLGG
jgi:hypothetical protein